MATKQKPKKPSDPIIAELWAIKQLLILQLITSGVQKTRIALALGLRD